MFKRVALVFTIAGLVLFGAACAPSSTATPASPTRTRVPTLPPLPSSTPTAVPTPTIAPTAVPLLTATPTTVALTPSVGTTVFAASPTPPATLPPTLTPTVAVQPGLYVTNLRIAPNPPVRGVDLVFYVTFLNSGNSDFNPRWLVYIYKADNPSHSLSETTALQSSIPPGTHEIRSDGSWKLGAGTPPCDYFFARVASLDINRRAVAFTQPDGAIFEKGFTICPP